MDAAGAPVREFVSFADKNGVQIPRLAALARDDDPGIGVVIPIEVEGSIRVISPLHTAVQNLLVISR